MRNEDEHKKRATRLRPFTSDSELCSVQRQEIVRKWDSKHGFHSVMVDGSHLPFEENVALTKRIVDIAHGRGITVEAELGRLSGSEDGLTVYEYEAKLTDVEQAKRFATETGVDALAVCVGNVHGKYPTSGPKLDLSRLKALHMAFAKSGPALVMHGASGLPPPVIQECISLGITKFNVNTELREAYMQAVSNPQRELINAMDMAVAAMEAVVAQKLAMFRSVGKSCH
ncbi:hypothetical protein CBR_g29815 [Chara braunii]|uniref:Fructose-bisphosphate aldolase n=1 Tax=Chara braunii TaxID=69332 RepID=A0A388LBG4_CHABU|nr:hypothetical protein CBR_g29815 [Chara braunii]|eukprot:GBG79667.1 hypothetical protein CBR_g29815 [Chara braunii]